MTLLELLLVVTISSLLALLAWPAFQATLASAKVRAESNALHHALHAARRESLKRNRFVALCKTSDGLRCTPTLPWSAGWMVFVDEDRDRPPQLDPGEPVIMRHRVPEGIHVVANRNAFVVRTLRYRTTNGTFAVCDDAGVTAALALVVSYTGRPRQRPLSEVRTTLNCPS